jgi:translation initiation factor RLI1
MRRMIEQYEGVTIQRIELGSLEDHVSEEQMHGLAVCESKCPFTHVIPQSSHLRCRLTHVTTHHPAALFDES